MGNKICSCQICEDDKIETNILSQGNNLKKEDDIDNNNLQKELISIKRNEKESNLTSRNRNSSNSTEIPDKNYLLHNNFHNSNYQSRNFKKEQNQNNNDYNSLNKTILKETIKDPYNHYENDKEEIIDGGKLLDIIKYRLDDSYLQEFLVIDNTIRIEIFNYMNGESDKYIIVIEDLESKGK